MLDDQSRQFFQQWYQTSLGEQLLKREIRAIDEEMDNGVGYYLSIQTPLHDLGIKNHRMRESFYIAPALELGAPDSSIIARSSELPLEGDGVDLHVLHHTLDISLEPHDDLREAARTLLPSGKMIIVGFNPWSMWGLRRLFSQRKSAPWCGRFISHARLEDWLKVAGLVLEKRQFISYAPPVQSDKWRSRFHWLGQYFKFLKLPFGGVYILTVTKETKRYIPIKPRWRGTRVRVTPLTKPTIKEIPD
ncbi:SAM-dependent methyltransferase [Marinomonas balearica]|uniref:Methyltransferase family protein n=1 Tax=Marinomonas balearica TaxID=491947 RepID=A0A4R6MBC1_9GAMM|nr:SAM-dependent methyltransferase [Marinomonas balearica]TDO98897.1 hypothetical protein DFP79_1312 [Marinomonas balearica]